MISQSKSEESATPRIVRKESEIRQWIFSLAANLSVLSLGMVLAFPAVSLAKLTSPDNPWKLNEDQASWFASINQVSCPLGGLLASYILDKFGRKLTINFIAILSAIAWTVLYLTPERNFDVIYYQLLVGRILSGFSGGLSGSPTTVYAAEIAHPQIRGKLTVLPSVTIAFGVLLIYFLGFVFQGDWRFISLIAASLCIMAFFISLFLPESPRWLAMKNKSFDEIEGSFYMLNGRGQNETQRVEIDKEIKELIQECCQKQPEVDSSSKSSAFWRRLQRPNVYKPMSFLIGFFTIQQLCGIFVIIVYIGQISSSVGVSVDVYLFTVITGSTRLIGVIIAGFVSDRIGRRSLGMISGLGISISTSGIVLCILFPFNGSLWFITCLMILHVFLSTIGYHTLPFSMMGELFPADIRGFATGFNIFYVNSIAFILIKLYPYLSAVVDVVWIFGFIGGVSLLGVVYLYTFLPETKGKTIKELEGLYT